MRTRTILVFHCEFSEKRAPSLWRSLRDLDRRINLAKCLDEAKIFYPEMYLLEKGFKGFFESHPELCVGGYKCQAGDLLEKSRYRSMQRNQQSYCVQDSVLQLKKSASHGFGAILPRPISDVGLRDAASRVAGELGKVNRVKHEFKIKSKVSGALMPIARARSNSDHWSDPSQK